MLYRPLLMLVVVLTCALTGWAQTKTEKKKSAPPVKAKANANPLKIGMYDGEGASGPNLERVERVLKAEGHTFSRVKLEDIEGGALKKLDVVIFPAGTGSGQGNALGDSGREAVREFVKNGGGYVGIGAGAYLGTAKYSWGLKLLNAQTIDSSHWNRGTGTVKIEFTDAGRKALGAAAGEHDVRYANGPLLGPAEFKDLPEMEVLAQYRSEMTENDAPSGVMPGTAAIAAAKHGKGRVILLSPHPEYLPGTEWLLVNAVNHAAGRPVRPTPAP